MIKVWFVCYCEWNFPSFSFDEKRLHYFEGKSMLKKKFSETLQISFSVLKRKLWKVFG
jgi:hypothetical protein